MLPPFSLSQGPIQANSVTNALLAQAPASTIKGNNTGSTANVADLTVLQAQSLLGITITFFLYKPQTITPGGNKFNSWSALYAKLIQTSGFRQINFDGTDDAFLNLADIHLPAGTWDMTGVTFSGLLIDGTNPVVIADQACFLPGLSSFGENIAIGSNSTLPVVSVTNIVGSMGFNCHVTSSSGTPFFEVNGGFAIMLLQNNASLDLDAFNLVSGFLLTYLGANGSVSSNSVTGDAGSTLQAFITVGSANFDQTQPGFSGSISQVLSDFAANHAYDSGSGVLMVDTVQQAIDLTASYTQTLRNAFDYVTMTTGGNHTIVDTVASCRLHATGTIVAYTVKMPANPLDGQLMLICTDQIVTTFTLQANTGQAFVGTPVTTLGLGVAIRYQWIATDSKWWPV